MEELFGRRKYLRTFLDSHAPPGDSEHHLQRSPGEVDSNISTSGLRFAYNQTNNPASHKTEIKTTDGIYWEARQVRQQEEIQVGVVLEPEAGR